MREGEFPPATTCRLDGWEPLWFGLEPTGCGEEELARLRRDAARRLRERFPNGNVAEDQVVGAVRKLFRSAGTDPTRYRPSSEALARRLLKGGELPGIHPVVDLNNLLSLRLMLPCCVVDPNALRPPFVLRRGRAGESMASLRGPFNLEGKPVFEDAMGPFGTPITDAERVRVDVDTAEVWLVVYAVAGMGGTVRRRLEELLVEAPVARLTG
ncbi:MAG: hypothetical protein GXP47_10710 [Acidobacteria bacterium]|nr:hypothetical protein [Acidobacteriota bacterium]